MAEILTSFFAVTPNRDEQSTMRQASFKAALEMASSANRGTLKALAGK